MDEEMLINLVRAHKELYDLNDAQYDVRPKRDSAWQQIAAAMKQSPRDCRDQWKRIRDCYRRAQKLRRIKCIQGAKITKRPKYETLLSFLNPYLRDKVDNPSERPRAESPHSSNDEDSGEQAHSPGTCSSRDSLHAHAAAAAYSVCVEPALAPDPPMSPSRSPYPLPHSDIMYTPVTPAYQPRRDKITDFFMGLIETVREFPEDVQIRVKREIFKVVNDAEELVYNIKSENQLNGLGFVKKDQE